MEAAIQEYINSSTNISPYDMVSELLPKFYPISDIVLDAAKYFTTIIKRKDFCVEQNKLVKYGILSPLKNGQPKCNNVLRLINQYNLIDNVDYHRLNVEPMVKSGTKHSIEYKMTPKTFFLCLTRSKNSCDYAIYYFHVLEIYDYYETYFTKMYKQQIKQLKIYTSEQDNIIMEKEDTISRIERMHKEMIAKMDKQSEKMDVMQGTLDKIVKKLDDRAIPPSDDELTERFALMKKDPNTYYVIRSQERRMSKAIMEKEKLGYFKIPDLLESELIPNSIYLWNCIRDELIKERKIKCKYNEIILSSISEEDLIHVIKQVFNSRKELN
jgi:hypothetical protein